MYSVVGALVRWKMSLLRNQWLLVLAAGLLLLDPGCSSGGNAVGLDAAVDARSDSGGSEGTDGSSPAPAVGSVEILTEPFVLAVGQKVKLSALARSPNGEVLYAVPILWGTSGEVGLRPSPEGTVEATTPGLYSVVAYSGWAFSEPVFVLVADPREEETRTVNVLPVLPSSLDGRTVRVVGPRALPEAVSGTGDVVHVTIRSRSNQLISVVDDASDKPIALRILRGESDEVAPDALDGEVEVDFEATAEALLFLRPGFVNPAPEAMVAFRKLLQDDPAVQELASALHAASSDGGLWYDRLDSMILPVMADIDARLQERLGSIRGPLEEARAALSDATSDDKADDINLLPLRPTVYPGESSGLTVTAIPCTEPAGSDRWKNVGIDPSVCAPVGYAADHAAVTVTNRYVRWVGGRIEPTQAGLPQQMPLLLKSAGPIPDLFEVLYQSAAATWSQGRLSFAADMFAGTGAYERATRVLPFDPNAGGSNTWYLYVFGPGLQGSSIPDHLWDSDMAWTTGFVPWALTAVFDVLGNAATVIEGAAAKTKLDDFAKVMKILAGSKYKLVYDLLLQIVEGGQIFDILTDLTNIVIDTYKEVLKEKSEYVKEVFFLLDVYSRIAAFINGACSLIDIVFYANYADWFSISGNMVPAISPQSKVLPDAQVGCPYQAELNVVDPFPGVTFTWGVSVGSLGPGWSYKFLGQAYDRLLLYTLPGKLVTAASAPNGLLELVISVGPVGAALLQYGTFRIPVLPAGPYFEDVSIGGSWDVPRPGAKLPVFVRVEECGKGVASSGTITGGALEWPASLIDDVGYLEGKVQLRSPLKQGPADLLVTANLTSGGTLTWTETIEVRNSAPRADRSTVFVDPGESVVLSFQIHDANFVGDNPQEIPLDGVTLDGGEALVTAEVPVASLKMVPDPDGTSPGVLGLMADKAVHIRSPLPDNDGSEGEEAQQPFEVLVLATDQGGLMAWDEEHGDLPLIGLTVRNKAPVIINEEETVKIAPGGPMLYYVVRATDDNGVADIAGIEFVGPDYGIIPYGVSSGGGEKAFEFIITPDSVVPMCDGICQVMFVARDADDSPDNHGYSEPFVLNISTDGKIPCSLDDDCPAECLGTGISEAASCVDWICSDPKVEDCPAVGKVCAAGRCAQACESFVDCPGKGKYLCKDSKVLLDWQCQDGGCVAAYTFCSSGGKVCQPDAQDAGAACVSPCKEGTVCPSTCSSDGEKEDRACQAGVCAVTASTPCGAQEVCQDGACLPGCKSDQDCPGQGVAACEGQTVTVWTCIDSTCKKNLLADCEAGGLVCKGAACVSGCTGDADCPALCDPAGVSVVAGVCGPDGQCAYTPILLCQTGETCVAGSCFGACQADADCPLPACSGAVTLSVWSCVGGKCTESAVACQAGQGCAPATPECLPGQVCGPPVAGCLPTCTGGLPCPGGCDDQGRAIHGACGQNGVCGSIVEDCAPQGKVCLDGQCVTACLAGDVASCPWAGLPVCADAATLLKHVCLNGACIPSLEPCPAGTSCQVDSCVPPKCVSDAGCPGVCLTSAWRKEFHCQDGVCQPGSTVDCGVAGKACVGGGCALGCQPPDVGCPFGLNCIVPPGDLAGWCQQCLLAADCPHQGLPFCDGNVVTIEGCKDHQCVAEALQDCHQGGETCVDGECTCTSDDQCVDDCFGSKRLLGYCALGKCAHLPPVECPSGQWCVDKGQCGMLCSAQQPCPDGFVCYQPPTGYAYCRQCTQDGDCPGAEVPHCSKGMSIATVCVDFACKDVVVDDCQSKGLECKEWKGECGPGTCESDSDCKPPSACVKDGVPQPLCGCISDLNCENGGATYCSQQGAEVWKWACQNDHECLQVMVVDCGQFLGGCLDGNCTIPGGATPCCMPHKGLGCAAESIECDACVCFERPQCCKEWAQEEDSWDVNCAAVAFGECQDVCECSSSCCVPHPEPSCDGYYCAVCVCEGDSSCCEGQWHAGCVHLAETACSGLCGCKGGPCTPKDTPLSGSPACDECVCFGNPAFQFPECCEVAWDFTCSAWATQYCPEECGCKSGKCCEAHAATGCMEPVCQDCVCQSQPSCCENGWGDDCVAIARAGCAAKCKCPGSCCGPKDSPDCDGQSCAQCVCLDQGYTYCCHDSWDAQCSDVAHLECAASCPCPGPCCEPHVAPSCDGEACSDCVCTLIPACCEVGWNVDCAAAAAQECLDSCQCPGDCCQAHALPGCNQSLCQLLVCAQMPDCCTGPWSDECAKLAATACGGLCGDCVTDEDCVDDSQCNTGMCVGSQCQFVPQDALCDDGVPCTTDACFEGFCSHVPDHPMCDDASPCTVTECQEAVGCVLLATCDDGIECTIDECTPQGCAHVPDLAECDDGVKCTQDECTLAGCVNSPLDELCSDNGYCTVDKCDPGSGCSHTPHDELCPAWWPCMNVWCNSYGHCKQNHDDCDCKYDSDCWVEDQLECNKEFGLGATACEGGECKRFDWEVPTGCIWTEFYHDTRNTGQDVAFNDGKAYAITFMSTKVPRTTPFCGPACAEVVGTWSSIAAGEWADTCNGLPEQQAMFPSPTSPLGKVGMDAAYHIAVPLEPPVQPPPGEDPPPPQSVGGFPTCAANLPAAHSKFYYFAGSLGVPGTPFLWGQTYGVKPIWSPAGYSADHTYRFPVEGGWYGDDDEYSAWAFKVMTGIDLNDRNDCLGLQHPGPVPDFCDELGTAEDYGQLRIRVFSGSCSGDYDPQDRCIDHPMLREDRLNVVEVFAAPFAGTASAEFTALPGLDASISTSGGPVLVQVQLGGTDASGPVAVETRIVTDGQPGATGYNEFSGNGWEARDVMLQSFLDLAPGPHSVTVEWRVKEGEGAVSTGQGGATASMVLIELKNDKGPLPHASAEADDLVVTNSTDWQPIPGTLLSFPSQGKAFRVEFRVSGVEAVGDVPADVSFRVGGDLGGGNDLVSTLYFGDAGGQSAKDVAQTTFQWSGWDPGPTLGGIEWRCVGAGCSQGTVIQARHRSIVVFEASRGDGGEMRANKETSAVTGCFSGDKLYKWASFTNVYGGPALMRLVGPLMRVTAGAPSSVTTELLAFDKPIASTSLDFYTNGAAPQRPFLTRIYTAPLGYSYNGEYVIRFKTQPGVTACFVKDTGYSFSPYFLSTVELLK